MTLKEKAKVIKDVFRQIFKYPVSILWVLKDDTEYKDYLLKKYGYNQFRTIDIRNFVTDENLSINNYTFLDGTSMITDILLLKSLAKKYHNCDYLEIGTWRGESIINVAETNASCTSINLSKEEIIKSGFGVKNAELNGCLINDSYKNIKRIYANSLTFNFDSLNQKFDVIFVDGDHSSPSIKSDTANVFKLLKDENSVIIWHDYAFNPEKPRYSTIAGILDGLPPQARKHVYHVSNSICAIYTLKNYTGEILEAPSFPDKLFSINLKISSNS